MKSQSLAIVIAILVTMLLVSSAQAGCGKWVVRYPETDFLDDPTFDAEIEASTGPTATAGEGVKTADADEDAGANPGNDVKAKDESGGSKAVKAQEQAEVPDASGNWLVHMDNMDNLAGSTLNLILIQSKDRLQGYGNLEEKSEEIPATTTGSISEDAISLDIKLVKDGTLNSDDRQYRLSLTLKKDAMKKGKLSGSYEYYLSDELASEGNATATRS